MSPTGKKKNARNVEPYLFAHQSHAPDEQGHHYEQVTIICSKVLSLYTLLTLSF